MDVKDLVRYIDSFCESKKYFKIWEAQTMSYLNVIKWDIVPKTLPKVKRNCPKCNKKTHFINSEKFRVNANKNNIDVWLIYQCEECKSTWNMTIHERVNPGSLDKEKYEKFMANDIGLAKEYAFNQAIYSRNKAEAIFDFVEYEVLVKEAVELDSNWKDMNIELICNYPVEMRVDKLLSEELGKSRSKIKSMHKNGYIEVQDQKNSLKSKVKDGMKINVINSEQSNEKKESA